MISGFCCMTILAYPHDFDQKIGYQKQMSAIFGILAPEMPADKRQNTLAKMLVPPHGRGTENPNIWHAPDAPISLAIRALTTTDLTPDGKQPALAASHRIAVVLDGYISNAPTLRRELEETGTRLRGHGDAELLAQAAAHFGLNRLLQKLEGAFAFALWDGNTGALHLVRDRMGIKPLFIIRNGTHTAFASNPNAFKDLPDYNAALDTESVQEYLSIGYVTAPKTLLKNVICIPPAARLMLQATDTTMPEPEAWWRPSTTLEEIALRNTNTSDSLAKTEKMQILLAAEAARADIGLTILDTGMAEARRLQAALERSIGKTIKTLSITTPNAIEVQTAFDALSQEPWPSANPAACTLWHTFNNADDLSGIILNAGSINTLNTEDSSTKTNTWPRPIRKLAATLLPKSFGHLSHNAQDIFKTRNTHWQGLFENKFTPALAPPPRMDMPVNDLAAYFDFCGPCIQNDLPMLDSITGSHNLELRLPWADQRLLEFYLPAPITLDCEIGNWLRGPLRIRMQNTLSNVYFDAFKICNKQILQDSWQKLLNGDNSQAKPIWAYLTLATWANTNDLI